MMETVEKPDRMMYNLIVQVNILGIAKSMKRVQNWKHKENILYNH